MRRWARRSATRRARIDNAVMVLHGTGGSGRQFLQPQFADELYGPGQPLDLARYYVILPDGIGHGSSSKPSDGLRMRFPNYDYDDMVEAQRRMLVEGLGVTRLQAADGHVDGLHARLRLGRDPSRFRPRADADGLPAGRDCRPQPDVAQAARSRAIRERPGLAGRQLRRPAGRRACAPRSASSRSPASRRSICSAPIRTARAAEAYVVDRIERDVADPRRQRPHLPGRGVAELRSLAAASTASARR